MTLSNQINPTFVPSYITIDGTERKYMFSGNGNVDNYKDEKLPIILLFHGNGEEIYNTTPPTLGILNYTELYSVNALIIAFQGQPDKTLLTSWQTCFPVMIENPLDDVAFVNQVVSTLPNEIAGENYNVKINKNKIFAIGKSDGAGFALYLSIKNPQLKIKALGLCSGTYLALNNSINFGNITNQNFILPENCSIPLLEFHGTGDQVMPYSGTNYLTSAAINPEGNPYNWINIDPDLVIANYFEPPEFDQYYVKSSNTYTANILAYWINWSKKNQNKCFKLINYGNNLLFQWYNKSHCSKKKSNPVVHVQITNQNHDWSGHLYSGPDSDSVYNATLDATVIVCHFLKIDYSEYTPTVSTDTSQIITYKN
jgi:predicted esterase